VFAKWALAAFLCLQAALTRSAALFKEMRSSNAILDPLRPGKVVCHQTHFPFYGPIYQAFI
jgi:hypothetical protein